MPMIKSLQCHPPEGKHKGGKVELEGGSDCFNQLWLKYIIFCSVYQKNDHDNTLLGSLPGLWKGLVQVRGAEPSVSTASHHTCLCSYPKSPLPALQPTEGQMPAQE